MSTLEREILYLKEKNLNLYNTSDCDAVTLLEKSRKYKQYISYLEELKELRKWKEEVMEEFCKVDCGSVDEVYELGVKRGYNKAVKELTGKDTDGIVNSIDGARPAQKIPEVLPVHQKEENPYGLTDEVWNAVRNLVCCFYGSSLLIDREPIEFLVHARSNTYFIIGNCNTKLDVDCKVLEWVSRAAYKTEPYQCYASNENFHRQMLAGINAYLKTDFGMEDMETICTYLGNACNHEKTIAFIQSGFNMEVLK